MGMEREKGKGYLVVRNGNVHKFERTTERKGSELDFGGDLSFNGVITL